MIYNSAPFDRNPRNGPRKSSSTLLVQASSPATAPSPSTPVRSGVWSPLWRSFLHLMTQNKPPPAHLEPRTTCMIEQLPLHESSYACPALSSYGDLNTICQSSIFNVLPHSLHKQSITSTNSINVQQETSISALFSKNQGYVFQKHCRS